MSAFPWWRGAVIYQIYPRSFLDTNGDGIGDLKGIAERLDYVAGLGVDAIWVSPFFKSPMTDFGYDIADFRAVDPLFGDLADFDRLVAQAHARGLKVMIDQVLSHTSSQHPWFLESRSSRDNPKADWYVWADPAGDGSPPNNWQSIFGGPAWRWEPRRRQYYLHNFLDSQPDLNFHNPRVPEAMLQNLEFWLERGVDGLRLDAINFCYHDRQLRNNPPKPAELRNGRGFTADNPYAYQYHWYNNTQPENLGFLTELRRLLDRYPGAVGLGEISAEDSLATMAEYIGETRLHMAYSFELLTEEYRAAHIRGTVESLERQMPHGWPCWTISNHDVARVMTRWGGAAASPGDVEHAERHGLLAARLGLRLSGRGARSAGGGPAVRGAARSLRHRLLAQLQGTGRLPHTHALARYGGCGLHARVRRGCPCRRSILPLAVSRQESDPDSPLNAFRRFLRWRSRQPALCQGDIDFIELPEPLLAFTRTLDSQSILAAFNLSDRPQAVTLPALGPITPLDDHGLSAGRVSGRRAGAAAARRLLRSVADEQRAGLGLGTRHGLD